MCRKEILFAIDHLNQTGANLVSGITTIFIEAMDYAGKCNVNTAVIEVDEAAFSALTNHIEPDILVVTNFFRDQLDRYGELYSTIKRVAEGIGKTKKTKLILNADDSLCVSLGKETGRTILSYYNCSCLYCL